jgi:hypothetical protein
MFNEITCLFEHHWQVSTVLEHNREKFPVVYIKCDVDSADATINAMNGELIPFITSLKSKSQWELENTLFLLFEKKVGYWSSRIHPLEDMYNPLHIKPTPSVRRSSRNGRSQMARKDPILRIIQRKLDDGIAPQQDPQYRSASKPYQPNVVPLRQFLEHGFVPTKEQLEEVYTLVLDGMTAKQLVNLKKIFMKVEPEKAIARIDRALEFLVGEKARQEYTKESAGPKPAPAAPECHVPAKADDTLTALCYLSREDGYELCKWAGKFNGLYIKQQIEMLGCDMATKDGEYPVLVHTNTPKKIMRSLRSKVSAIKNRKRGNSSRKAHKAHNSSKHS